MKTSIGKSLVTLCLVLLFSVAMSASAFAAAEFTIQVPLKLERIPDAYANRIFLQAYIYDASKKIIAASATTIPIQNGGYTGSVTVSLNRNAGASQAIPKTYVIMLACRDGNMPPYIQSLSRISYGGPIPGL